MGWKEIDLDLYASRVKENLRLKNDNDIIEKDLLLTLILAEFEKHELGQELIFKGGTLLSRNYLKYHRFSEDIDFVHKDSNKLRELPRKKREKEIKRFIDKFCPILKKISEELGLDFSEDRSNQKYCRIMHPRSVYTFKVHYDEERYIKIEINFVEKVLYPRKKVSVKSITDFFDSEDLLFQLNLDYDNFNVSSYSIKEIILEKYRAVLTRPKLQDRDLFDLFLIKGSLQANEMKVVKKIEYSSLIKKELKRTITEKLEFLKKGEFFEGEEKAEELAVKEFSTEEFEKFKQKIKPKLIEICKQFLKYE